LKTDSITRSLFSPSSSNCSAQMYQRWVVQATQPLYFWLLMQTTFLSLFAVMVMWLSSSQWHAGRSNSRTFWVWDWESQFSQGHSLWAMLFPFSPPVLGTSEGSSQQLLIFR
jgi:hypothetical protein